MKKLFALLCTLAMIGFAAGCSKAERAGDDVTDAAREAVDTVDDAADEANEAAIDAVDEVEDAVQ